MSKTTAAINVIKAVADTIRESGEVISGTLYAALMTQGCTMSQYEQIVGVLTRSGLVVKNGDMLRWAAK